MTCKKGCGCFCTSDIDCVRWCEPVVVEPVAGRQGPGDGGIVRTFKAADGTDQLVINAMATDPDGDLPRHAAGTRLQGCMKGSTLESLALVLGTLHGKTVTAPTDRARTTVDDRISGTLEEIAERFGLTVG
jgi:hypothetical protein